MKIIEIHDLQKKQCSYDLAVDFEERVFHLYDNDEMVSIINTVYSTFCRELISYVDQIFKIDIEQDINKWKYIVYTPCSDAAPSLIQEYKPMYEGNDQNPFISSTVEPYQPFVKRLKESVMNLY